MAPLANTISPTLVTVPGFGLLGLHVAFTLSVLAALIERPFVTRAGVRRFALCASLQANFLTTLVVLLCTPIAIGVLGFPVLLLAGWPIAVWVSYRVEYAWYRRHCGRHCGRHCSADGIVPFRAPIWWGNVASNLTFFAMLLVSPEPSVGRLQWLHSFEPGLTIATATGCAAIYFTAFVIPALPRHELVPDAPSHPRADPLPAEAPPSVATAGDAS